MEKVKASRRQFLKRSSAASSLGATALTSIAPLQGQPVAAKDVHVVWTIAGRLSAGRPN